MIRIQPRRSPAGNAVEIPPAALVRTHWTLAVCVVCGHEHPRGENARSTCPTCGATLHNLPLYARPAR